MFILPLSFWELWWPLLKTWKENPGPPTMAVRVKLRKSMSWCLIEIEPIAFGLALRRLYSTELLKPDRIINTFSIVIISLSTMFPWPDSPAAAFQSTGRLPTCLRQIHVLRFPFKKLSWVRNPMPLAFNEFHESISELRPRFDPPLRPTPFFLLSLVLTSAALCSAILFLVRASFSWSRFWPSLAEPRKFDFFFALASLALSLPGGLLALPPPPPPWTKPFVELKKKEICSISSRSRVLAHRPCTKLELFCPSVLQLFFGCSKVLMSTKHGMSFFFFSKQAGDPSSPTLVPDLANQVWPFKSALFKTSRPEKRSWLTREACHRTPR